MLNHCEIDMIVLILYKKIQENLWLKRVKYFASGGVIIKWWN